MDKAAQELQGKAASYFSWCGHIARITTRDPSREASKLFLHKTLAWLRSLKIGTGHKMSWTSLQSLEVGASSGTVSWVETTKQHCVASEVGRDDQLERNEEWWIVRVRQWSETRVPWIA